MSILWKKRGKMISAAHSEASAPRYERRNKERMYTVLYSPRCRPISCKRRPIQRKIAQKAVSMIKSSRGG